MKVVIDTNVLLVSISTKSLRHPIFKALTNGELILCATTDILLEYEEIFNRKYSQELSYFVMDLIKELPKTVFIDLYFKWNLLKDQDDNKFVDCAFATQADYIITDDKDFNI